LGDLTSPRAGARSLAVLVVPVGATEQHGPHLPVGTDTNIARAIAVRAAERRSDVLVAPAIAYGSSGEHQSFPGTLSIGAEVTEQLLVELGRSATATWSRVLLLCAHGGNAAPVRRAVTRLRREGRDVRDWWPCYPDGDLHAGDTETSLMLALDPATVDADHVATAVGPTASLAQLISPMQRGGVAAVSVNGVLGDARQAEASKGTNMLEAAVADLVDTLDAWAGGAGPT